MQPSPASKVRALVIAKNDNTQPEAGPSKPYAEKTTGECASKRERITLIVIALVRIIVYIQQIWPRQNQQIRVSSLSNATRRQGLTIRLPIRPRIAFDSAAAIYLGNSWNRKYTSLKIIINRDLRGMQCDDNYCEML